MPSWMNYRPVLVVAIIICFALAGFKAAEKNVIIKDDDDAVWRFTSRLGSLKQKIGGPQVLLTALDESIRMAQVSVCRHCVQSS